MTSLVDSILKNSDFEKHTNTWASYNEQEKYKNLIKETCSFIKIDEVRKLSNKYLYAAFILKKSEKKDYKVIELLHSTAAENVESIKNNNLDWRLVRRAKYGYGVSFSGDADYANYHRSWAGGNRKAFIVCDVLVDSIEEINKRKETPTEGYDTVRSTNGWVYVKFEDFTFYPKFALYYEAPSRSLSKFYYYH